MTQPPPSCAAPIARGIPGNEVPGICCHLLARLLPLASSNFYWRRTFSLSTVELGRSKAYSPTCCRQEVCFKKNTTLLSSLVNHAFPQYNIPMSSPERISVAPIEGLKLQSGVYTRASENHKERNEDAYFSLTEKGVFGVFDAPSGRGMGEVASAMARTHIKMSMQELPENPPEEEVKRKMREAFRGAHQRIIEEAKKDPDLRELATTATVVQILKGENGKRRAIIANAGDSRAYVLRKNGTLECITRDDSLINYDLLAEGKSEEEVKKYQAQFSNYREESEMSIEEHANWLQVRDELTNGLGMSPRFTGEPNIYTVDLEEGDVLLLSTDGLHENLRDTERDGLTPSIADILKEDIDSEPMARALVQAAWEKGEKRNFRSKRDDITALIIKPK